MARNFNLCPGANNQRRCRHYTLCFSSESCLATPGAPCPCLCCSFDVSAPQSDSISVYHRVIRRREDSEPETSHGLNTLHADSIRDSHTQIRKGFTRLLLLAEACKSPVLRVTVQGFDYLSTLANSWPLWTLGSGRPGCESWLGTYWSCDLGQLLPLHKCPFLFVKWILHDR